MDDSASAVPSPPRSLALAIAVVVLLAQAVGLLGIAVWLVVLALTEPETSVGAGFAEAVITLGVAMLLGFAARSLRSGRSGMRGVAIFVQLLILPLGYYLAQADLWVFAIVAWLVGGGTAVLLMLPSTRASVGVD